MAAYKSEYEKFLEEALARHPDWESGQREGLNLLWNKKVNFAELAAYRQSNEQQKPYPYDVNFYF
ncbi:DUF3460 family protein [Propionivibrio sp.]|jgi:hypothetical protein|uniref:DUF3460 family protein n=1 Tax=Propionivibrio sp. TaxID=2212460 RepID=UPI0039E3EFA1